MFWAEQHWLHDRPEPQPIKIRGASLDDLKSYQWPKAIVDEKMQAYTSFKASKAYKELEERVAMEKEKR